MKALLTAGGHGTRLRPITYTLNKHLIPLANKPMIFYALEKIAEAGIKEVLININPEEKEIPKVVGDGSKWQLNIKYLEQTGGPKGLAHILKIAKPWLEDSPLLFYLGDNLILNPIKEFMEEFQKGDFHGLLALSKVRDPQRFGVPEIKNGKIVRVEEKPQKPKSDFAVTGIYLYQPVVFKALDYIKPSFRGELEISDVHTWLIENGYKVGFKEITGWWKDTGKPEDLFEGNALILKHFLKEEIRGEIGEKVILEGKVKIGEGSKILGETKIKGPVIIGKNCWIENSFIGPNVSVGDNVKILESKIQESIILSNSLIWLDGKKIIESLIGEGAKITPASQSLPQGHKIVVGKDSQIEL